MYRVEIDLSNKLEASGATIIALANEVVEAVKVPAKVKQTGVEALKSIGVSKKHIYPSLWAALLFLLLITYLEPLAKHAGKIVIDNDFDGYQAKIKQDLLKYIRRRLPRFPAHKIEIASIGKRSLAHKKALAVYRGKNDKANRTMTEPELLEVLQA